MKPARFSPSSRRRRRAERGSVLIVVLWACLGLVSMVLVFNHSMLMTYRGADNDLAGRQAEQALEGAARYAQIVLQNTNTTTPGLFPDPASTSTTTYQSENVVVGDGAFWFIGRSWNVSSNMVGTTRSYGLVDEASKLNLNSATKDMLMRLPNMTDDFAAAIIDWYTASGASTTTASGGVNYIAKHAPFESIEELLLVSGATRDILYGQDANLNGMAADDNQQTTTTTATAGTFTPGILEYVTAFTREPNKASDGTDRKNIRQMSPQQLAAALGPVIGDGRAGELTRGLPGGTRFNSLLELYVRLHPTADEFAKISDALTAADPAKIVNGYIPGLVNVNTASETVLACIDGISADKAASIVAARAGRSTTDTNIAWVGDLLDQTAARAAGPFLTGRSYQVSADIAAVGRRGRGYRRERFVIDISTGTPRIVYRRNLTPLGWALGSDVRQTLANNAAKGVQQ